MGRISPEKREAMRSVGFLAGGRTRPDVRTVTLPGGERAKRTRDELGNVTTERDQGQDVTINAKPIALTTAVKAE